MSSKKNIMLSGVAALVVAASILAVSMLSGFPLLQNVNTTTGTLAILLTDPPHVPAGVTAVNIAYSNLAVHISEAGNLSGWTVLKQSGSIELLGTVNIGQTIASVNIAKGDYNLLRFNVSSATVTYNGNSYTAFVPSSELTVPIIGGIEVNASKPSATIINIEPTVFNIGSTSSPEFIIRPAAKAFPIPSSQVNEAMEHEGSKISLVGKAWWTSVQEKFTANAQITIATLTTKSLALTAKNTGAQTTKLRLVIVVPVAPSLRSGEESLPPTLWGSAVFVALPNGTLVPLQKFILTQSSLTPDRESILDALASEGYTLAAGASTTLSYTGMVTLGFQFQSIQPVQSIVPGQQYLVTVLGDEALASQVVVAGQ